LSLFDFVVEELQNGCVITVTILEPPRIHVITAKQFNPVSGFKFTHGRKRLRSSSAERKGREGSRQLLLEAVA
jgi:hypothetical protein